ncbi:golgi SNAP receptor complex member Gos28 isoform X2 [Andrena cerasifolii]|uniref:golgi SNAP receptor complex member Gos28 isoform X2 n=1 Tax=Andrena cerasifolii TaxID=2819439 RepID=UPI0040376B12
MQICINALMYASQFPFKFKRSGLPEATASTPSQLIVVLLTEIPTAIICSRKLCYVVRGIYPTYLERSYHASQFGEQQMASALDAVDWEDLRRQARHLENEIDAKLVAFSKLGINSGSKLVNSDEVPLLDEEHVFENMASEIEALLAKLFSINERMSELQPNGAAMLHTMQRHKDILKDYKLEFSKIRNNFAARRDREDLLGSVRKEIDNYKSASGLNRREMYLKENQHIHNSDRLINDQISIAMETREHLVTQRQAFKRIQTRLNDISNRFPAVNSLIQRINLRKRRDSLILGLIVGFCTFLMLLYAFH